MILSVENFINIGVGYQLIILLYLFRQRAGKVRHVPKENLECSLAS